jgi:hypothetical protein
MSSCFASRIYYSKRHSFQEIDTMMSIGRNLGNQFLVSCIGLACQNSVDHRRFTRCLVPAFGGAYFSREWEGGQILHRSATTTEAIRRAIQHSQKEPKDALETAWHQPEDSGQVEEAQFNGRSSNWPNRSQVHRLVHRAGGRHRCVSQAHSAAAR